MVGRPGVYQPSFNSGEFAPEVSGRTDVKFFYSAAAKFLNCEPVPQGGFRLLPRSRHVAPARTKLETLSGTLIISDGLWSTAGTVAEMTFAEPVEVALTRINQFRADVAVDDILQVQWWDGEEWQAVAPPFSIGTSSRWRSAAAPPGEPVLTTSIRVVLVEAPPQEIDLVLTNLLAWREAGEVSLVRYEEFTFSSDQTYMIAFTDRCADIWRVEADSSVNFVAGVWTALSEATVAGMGVLQRLDAMLVFHSDMASSRIMRSGADHEWELASIPWENVPEVDYGGDYVDTIDTWQLYLRHPSSGQRYDRIIAVSVNGEEAAGVDVDNTGGGANADIDDFCAKLKDALEALPAVAPGIAITRVGVIDNAFQIQIRFTGAGNSGQTFSIAAQVVSHTDSAATVGRTVLGKAGGEPLISAERGYAACGAFYQDRLVTGGFKARPQAFVASVTGEYFDLNIGGQSPSAGLLIGLDTDGAERIHNIVRARHLVFFTTSGEYFIADRAVDATQPPNVVQSSQNGSAEGVRVVDSEGVLLYVSRNRSLIYSAEYDDIRQGYTADPLSLLASHLIKGIIGADLQKASLVTDANRYFLVRDDGVLVIGLLIRNQEVTGFVRWETDGQVRDVAVDGRGGAWLVVDRDVDGTSRRFLERFEDDLLLDGAISFSRPEASALVDGLAIHEGAEVWALADGWTVGPFTVQDGEIELPFAAEEVTVGRWTPPVVKSLRLPRDVAERVVVERPATVHSVRMHLIGTTSIALAANDGPVENIPLYRAGDATDIPPVPYTGPCDVEGLLGYSDEGAIEITQVRPGRLQVRDVTIEAEF